MKDNSVCVFDFNGYTSPGHFFTSMWADYYPDKGIVVFGGDWDGIPNMISSYEPGEKEILEYVKNNGG